MDADRDFGPVRSGDLHKDFFAWLHHLARRVPLLRRRVVLSEEAQGHRAQYPAIDELRRALQTGQNVGPWLSERTLLHPADHRADLMFNDWQILHFHLGNIYASPTTVERTGPILCAHVTAEEATFLDVQPHRQWARLELLEILLRTNPAIMARYEARGCAGERLTDEQYLALRQGGGNALIQLDGRAFMPAMGRMSSQHAVRIVLYADNFWLAAESLKHGFENDQIEEPFRRLIYSQIGLPVRLGAHYDPTGLSIIDKNRMGLQLHKMKPIE